MSFLQRLGIDVGAEIDERVVFLMDTARVQVTTYSRDAARTVSEMRRAFLRQLSSDDQAGLYFVEVLRERGEKPVGYMIEADNFWQATQCALRLELDKGYTDYAAVRAVLMTGRDHPSDTRDEATHAH